MFHDSRTDRHASSCVQFARPQDAKLRNPERLRNFVEAKRTCYKKRLDLFLGEEGTWLRGARRRTRESSAAESVENLERTEADVRQFKEIKEGKEVAESARVLMNACRTSHVRDPSGASDVNIGLKGSKKSPELGLPLAECELAFVDWNAQKSGRVGGAHPARLPEIRETRIGQDT